MSNDVFDEDLMRELGLDPEDIANVKVPPPPQKKSVPPAPQPQSQTQPRSDAKPVARPPAPKPPQEPSLTDKTQAEPVSQPPQSPRPAVPADPRGHAERIVQGIPVHLAAVVAKKSIPLREAVELSVGEVVDFKKSPEEPIDLVANGKLVAKAELVMIDGKIGARIVKLVR
jgi:flagellar motor switch protein FliN/FliY